MTAERSAKIFLLIPQGPDQPETNDTGPSVFFMATDDPVSDDSERIG